MKRYLSLLIVTALAAGILAGCGGSSSSSETTAAAPAATEAAETEASEEDAEPVEDASSDLGDFPNKAITWVAPVAAGAQVDLTTRALADCVDFGQPCVVENIEGASQVIGSTEVSNRDADGYTILSMANASIISQPLMGNTEYSPSDFRFLTMLAPGIPTAVTVRSDSELQTLEDWIDYVQNNEFNYGISNVGGVGHLATVAALDALGAVDNATQIAYSGSAENATAILNGEVDFSTLDTTDALPFVESGEMRVLGIIDDEECDLFPGIPPISDYGVEGMHAFIGIKVIVARADTPEARIDYLKKCLDEAISTDAYQDWLIAQGFGAMEPWTEEECNELIDEMIESWGKVLKEVGIIE